MKRSAALADFPCCESFVNSSNDFAKGCAVARARRVIPLDLHGFLSTAVATPRMDGIDFVEILEASG